MVGLLIPTWKIGAASLGSSNEKLLNNRQMGADEPREEMHCKGLCFYNISVTHYAF